MYCYNCMREIENGCICNDCLRMGGTEVSPHHLRPGQVLNGKYLVGNCIGEGGFGITYIGRDLILDIKVAIKEFFPNGYVNRNNAVTQEVSATTQEQKDFFRKGKIRFLEEAKNIAKFIDEPGVVGVREFFETNGTAYIIMEYLDGVNLSRYVRQHGKMPANKVFELMLPVMKSLQRIHEAGIIHRDISPDNIMFMRNGTLKLMDFGSARYFANEEKEMSVMLKQGYAPEEQYRKNGHQGPWTDVYGLCATMYRCITGVVPIDALDRMHEDKLKKPSQIDIDISPALEAVLMYGLAVRQESRYKDMQELRYGVQKAMIYSGVATKNYVRNNSNNVNNNANSSVNNNQNSKVVYAEPPHDENDPRLNKKPEQAEHYTYGDSFTKREYENVSPKSEKSGVGVVITAVIMLLVLIAAIVAFFYYVMPMITDSNDDNKNKTNSTVTIEQTEPESQTEPQTEPMSIVEKVKVPDVEGLSLTEATRELNDSGFKVRTEYLESDTVDENCIISQIPKGGEKRDEGYTITLYVAQKAEEPSTEISEQEIDDYVKLVDDYYVNGEEYDNVKYKTVPAGTSELDYEREYVFVDGVLVLAVVSNEQEDHWYYFSDDVLIRYYGPEVYCDRDAFDYYNSEYNTNLYEDEEFILNEAY